MTGRPYVLAEATWGVVRESEYQVALLPWGATEPHNYHLPYGTDSIQVERIAIQAARTAWGEESRVIVLPTIPFGVNTTQLGLGPTINMHPSTQTQVLSDIVQSLEAAEIPRLVIVNGHGGNNFKQIIREVQSETSVFLCVIDWFTILPSEDYFTDLGEHAGEAETSLMQHLAPELVLPLDQAGEGAARKFKVKGLREGWAWAPRDWVKVTDDTGVGNPRAAAPEKGERYFRDLSEKIAEFLVDFASCDLNNMYE